MLLFNKFKRSEVKWILQSGPQNILSNHYIPDGVFANIKKYDEEILKTKCPAVSSIHNRIFTVNSFLNVDVTFFVNEEGIPDYTYQFDRNHLPTEMVHDLIKKSVTTQFIGETIDSGVQLQMTTPYAFVTDDKDLEIVSIPPNLDMENCIYVPGSLKPYYWVRPLNPSFILKDVNKPAKIKFSVDKPFMMYMFNKPINLEFTEQTDTIKAYANSVWNIVNYRRRLEKFYMNVVKRRPRKLL